MEIIKSTDELEECNNCQSRQTPAVVKVIINNTGTKLCKTCLDALRERLEDFVRG